MRLQRSHILFAAMCLIWGTTWIAIKVGVAAVPPILFAGTRFTVAGAALVLFLWWRGDRLRIARSDRPRLVAVTLLTVTATYALLFWGARYVSSGLAAVLDLALLPIALTAIGAMLGEDQFTVARGGGMAVGMGGLGVLFGPKAWAGGAGGSMELAGAGAIVLCALTYSLGAVLARPLLRAYSPVLLSGVTLLGGGLVLLAGALVLEQGAVAALPGRWSAPAWAAWLFLVVFGSLTAYTIFLHLVREWGASHAGSYAFVSPAVAVLLGAWVFGEAITLSDAAGMAMMLLGAWLTLRPAPASGPTVAATPPGIGVRPPAR